MQGVNFKSKNVTDADLVAISFCISKIKKLSGIEKIRRAPLSSAKIPLLVKVVEKMDEPVRMEFNLMYMINNYFFLLMIFL